jgi:CRISPR/Cas system endoribonuclease Cas6 (RAMP superfamily)
MIQIATNNQIILDGTPTRFSVVQTPEGTTVYERETGRTVSLPLPRYMLASDTGRTNKGVGTLAQFEAEIRRMENE